MLLQQIHIFTLCEKNRSNQILTLFNVLQVLILVQSLIQTMFVLGFGVNLTVQQSHLIQVQGCQIVETLLQNEYFCSFQVFSAALSQWKNVFSLFLLINTENNC